MTSFKIFCGNCMYKYLESFKQFDVPNFGKKIDTNFSNTNNTWSVNVKKYYCTFKINKIYFRMVSVGPASWDTSRNKFVKFKIPNFRGKMNIFCKKSFGMGLKLWSKIFLPKNKRLLPELASLCKQIILTKFVCRKKI